MKNFTFLASYFLVLSMISALSPRNPTADIVNANPDFSTVLQTENTFNAARRVEEMQLGLTANSIKDLDLPSQATWNGYSSDQKMLYLLNDERTSRGGIVYLAADGPVKGLPFQGVEEGQDGVSQNYAQLLLDNMAFTHTFGGTTSGTRLDVAIPNMCREFTARSENLYGAGGGSNIFPDLVEASVFVFNYQAASCGWGHREMCLLQDKDLQGNDWGFTDNNGVVGQEGFIGVGVAIGGNQAILVLNHYDPVADANFGTCGFNITVSTNSLMGGNGGGASGSTCADPIIITAAGTFNAPGPSMGNGASSQLNAGGVATHANWYRFTPLTTGTIAISSCGAANTHNHIFHNFTSCTNTTADVNNGNVVYTQDRGCQPDPNNQANGTLLTGIPVTAGTPIYIEWDNALSSNPFTWTLAYEGGPQCLVNVTVNAGVTMGNTLASASITTQGAVTANTAVFSAPEVNMNADFSVPAGQCFEVNNVGCACTGTQDAEPAMVNCWDAFVFNTTTCAWDNTGTPQGAPNAGTDGALTICAGTILTEADLFAQLGGTPNTGGVWTNIGLVHTYTLTAIAPCSGSASATVTVTEDAVSTNADPGIGILMSPSSLSQGSTGTLSAIVGNYGNGTIVENSLRVTISVGANAEIIGVAPGSDLHWSQLSLTTGSGNTIQLTNTGGGFSSFDGGSILLTVQGNVVSVPDVISGNIVYITAQNPLLCGSGSSYPLNASQGNASNANDNAQTSLAVNASNSVRGSNLLIHNKK